MKRDFVKCWRLLSSVNFLWPIITNNLYCDNWFWMSRDLIFQHNMKVLFIWGFYVIFWYGFKRRFKTVKGTIFSQVENPDRSPWPRKTINLWKIVEMPGYCQPQRLLNYWRRRHPPWPRPSPCAKARYSGASFAMRLRRALPSSWQRLLLLQPR